MIVRLLCLKCDFCTEQVTDEFEDEVAARELMASHGWSRERVENGSLWDKCPKCNGVLAGNGSIGFVNQHNQTVIQPMSNSCKVWMKCGVCEHTYLCDSDKTDGKTCPRQKRHDVLDVSP